MLIFNGVIDWELYKWATISDCQKTAVDQTRQISTQVAVSFTGDPLFYFYLYIELSFPSFY